MKHLPGKISRWVFVGLAALLCLLAVAYLFRGALLAPRIKGFLEASMESKLGIRPEIGRIDGSYVTNLELTRVTGMTEGPGRPFVRMDIEKLRVDYRLWSLLKGIDAFLAHMTITVEGARLELNLSSAEETAAPGAAAGPLPRIFLPKVLPRIHIRDASVSIRGPGYETAFKQIGITTRENGRTARELLVKVGEWRWIHPYFKDGKTSLSAVIGYENGAITVGPVVAGGSTLVESVRFELENGLSAIPFDAKFTLADGHVRVKGSLDDSTLNAHLEANHIHLAPIVHLFRPPEPELAGTLSMKSDVVLPLRRAKDMEVHLDLGLDRGRIYGLNADHVEAAGSAGAGMITLERVVLRTGSNIAEAKGLAAPVEAVFAGNLRGLLQAASGTVSADCRDLPMLFSATGVGLPPEVDRAPSHRLVLTGHIGNGVIDLTQGSLDVGDGAHIRLAPSQVALPARNRPLADALIQAGLEMDVSDLGLVSRVLPIPALSGSLRGNVAVAGTFRTPRASATASGKGISFKDIPIGDVNLRATADTREASVESIGVERGKDHVRGKGKFVFDKRAVEDAQFDFRISNIAPYAEMVLPENWKARLGNGGIAGALSGHITVAGPISMPHGTASLEARQIRIGENPFGDATVRFQMDGQRLQVEAFEVRHLQDRLALSGSFQIAPGSSKIVADNLNMEIAVSQMSAYTKNLLPKGDAVKGSFHGTLRASGPLTEPKAQFEMACKGVHWGRIDLRATRVKGSSSGRRITIDRAEAEAARGKVSLSGVLVRAAGDTAFDLELDTLDLSGRSPLLALDKPAYIRFVSGGELRLEDVSMSGPAGRIRLDGAISRAGKSDLRVLVSGGTGEGWFNTLVTDRLKFSGLDARARLTGTLDAPDVIIEGELAKLAGPKDLGTLDGRFDLTFQKEGVAIRRFEWRGDKGQEIAAKGVIPINVTGTPVLTEGPLSVDATVNLSELRGFDFLYPGYIPPGGSLHGELHMKGTWDAPSGEIFLRARDLKRPPQVKPMPSGPFDMDARIRFKDASIFVESARVRSPDLTFSADGKWTGMPALVDIFRGGLHKVPGVVSLKGRLDLPNLGWLAQQSPAIRRISGELEADVSLEGPLSNPTVTGSIRLTHGELRPDMDVPSVQAIQLKASASPDRLQLQTLTGELGGAPFQVTGSLERNGQSGINVDLRLQGENLLFYRSEGVKVRADADLTLKGPPSRLNLAGQVAITDGYYLKYLDVLSALKGSGAPKSASGFQLFSIEGSRFSNTRFDVHISYKKPFKIRNNLIQGALRPDLKLTGTGEIPVLTGVVYLDSTRLSLPAGSVVFDSGVIRFDRSRPDRPSLDLIGKSRMAGYDITIAVEGPYDDPKVTLSSVPPVSNEDLLLLVLTGRIPESSGGLTHSQRQKVNVAVYLGRDLIARLFSRQGAETEESILDRFQIEIGKTVTRAGDDTIDAQFRLVKGFPGKGDTLYITGEKDAFDFFNAGIKIVFSFK